MLLSFELGFATGGLEIGGEIGFVGFFDVFDFFHVVGFRGGDSVVVLGGRLRRSFVRRFGFRLAGAMARDGFAWEQAAAVPLDGGVDESGGLGKAGGVNGRGRFDCARSIVGRGTAILAERLAGQDERCGLRRGRARGARWTIVRASIVSLSRGLDFDRFVGRVFFGSDLEGGLGGLLSLRRVGLSARAATMAATTPATRTATLLIVR